MIRCSISAFLLAASMTLVSGQLSAQSVTIEAEAGDGIYSLLRKGGLKPNSATVSEFRRLNKELIGENNRIFTGKSYMIPDTMSGDSLLVVDKEEISISDLTHPDLNEASGDSLTLQAAEEESADNDLVRDPIEEQFLHIPLFGSEHEKVRVVSDQLKGTYYHLVSGHGGPDPGAVGNYGKTPVSEDEYAYDVVLRLARRLLSHGATVYVIIRDEDDGIRADRVLKMDRDEVSYPDNPIPRTQKARLRQRTNAVNKLYLNHKGQYQRLVVTHVDSRSAGQNIDVFFYHDKRSKTGKNMALQLQNTFAEKYAKFQPNRPYHGSVVARDLYVLKYSYPPAVFIELGNIRNKADQKRFMIRENREALANWICAGLIEEYKSSRKNESNQ